MPDAANDLYAQVCRHAVGTAVLGSIEEALCWDERTKMPAAGGEHRAEQVTLLAGIIHQRWTDPKFGEQLAGLAESPMADLQHGDKDVTIRRLKRQYDRRVKLPRTLVEELARTASLGEQAWQEARTGDDFPAFQPLLEKMIGLKQQEAEALGYGESPYDALLDDYEPGELTSTVAEVLADLREQLVPLVAEIRESGRRPDVSILHRKFPVEVQEAFGREAAAAIGFDFERGRLDVTTHPFCASLGPHDCRITTRYDENFFQRCVLWHPARGGAWHLRPGTAERAVRFAVG